MKYTYLLLFMLAIPLIAAQVDIGEIPEEIIGVDLTPEEEAASGTAGLIDTDPPYLYDNTTRVFFNETVLNNTIDSRASIADTNCNPLGTCLNMTYLEYENLGNLNISGNVSINYGEFYLNGTHFHEPPEDVNPRFYDSVITGTPVRSVYAIVQDDVDDIDRTNQYLFSVERDVGGTSTENGNNNLLFQTNAHYDRKWLGGASAATGIMTGFINTYEMESKHDTNGTFVFYEGVTGFANDISRKSTSGQNITTVLGDNTFELWGIRNTVTEKNKFNTDASTFKINSYGVYNDIDVRDNSPNTNSTSGGNTVRRIYGTYQNMLYLTPLSSFINESAILYAYYISSIAGNADENYGYFNDNGDLDNVMGLDGSKTCFGNEGCEDSYITFTGGNLEFHTNISNATGVAWFSHNVSAAGYITRTQANNDTDALEKIQDGNNLLNPDGSINHSAYGECYTTYEVTDYSQPENKEVKRWIFTYTDNGEENKIEQRTQEEADNLETALINWGVSYDKEIITQIETSYPHTKTEEGVNLDCETALYRQALALLNRNIDVSPNLTDFDTGIMAEEIYTQSKTINDTEKYLRKFDKNELKNKNTHYAYQIVQDNEVLNMEERIVALEGAIADLRYCALAHKNFKDYQECIVYYSNEI